MPRRRLPPAAALLLATLLAACGGGRDFAPPTPDGIRSGPGLLTGPDGEWVLHRR